MSRGCTSLAGRLLTLSGHCLPLSRQSVSHPVPGALAAGDFCVITLPTILSSFTRVVPVQRPLDDIVYVRLSFPPSTL
jgi:hypothetical protein